MKTGAIAEAPSIVISINFESQIKCEAITLLYEKSDSATEHVQAGIGGTAIDLKYR